MDNRVRAYMYEVNTNKGPVLIYLKWAEEDIEGERFEKASKLGIAPRSIYIPLGYIVSEHAHGTKLGDLMHYTNWISEEKNYRQLFKKLGEKLAILEKNNILYSDWLSENTFVKNDGKEIEIKIIDYEDTRLTAYDEFQKERIAIFIRNHTTPTEQIQKIINQIDINETLKQKMFEIFKTAYLKELEKPT